MNQEKVWDSIAEKWAKFRVYPTKEVVKFLNGKEGKLLDLGCGSGRHAPTYEKKGKLKFYGVDFSKELLKFAKNKNYVEIKKEFCYTISYNDEFFDYVIFARVLHCIDSAKKRKKSLEEIYRVLKIGGEALITSWGRGSKRVKNQKKEGYLSWTLGNKKVERYTYIYDFEELRNELLNVGFEIVRGWEDKNSCFIVRKI